MSVRVMGLGEVMKKIGQALVEITRGAPTVGFKEIWIRMWERMLVGLI